MKKEKKVWGFQTGKHIIDIKAESEQKAFVILARKFFEFIDKEGRVELMGERTTTKLTTA